MHLLKKRLTLRAIRCFRLAFATKTPTTLLFIPANVFLKKIRIQHKKKKKKKINVLCTSIIYIYFFLSYKVTIVTDSSISIQIKNLTKKIYNKIIFY
jgi:hypothetical protein